MESALNLGLKYLWIDRYSVNQQNHTERVQEIRRMDEIYQGAQVVLIDAMGQGPTLGLADLSYHRDPQLRLRTRKHELIVMPPPPQSRILDSKWATRGWTYQESRMARRRIFFTREQVYSECQVHSFTETLCCPNLHDAGWYSRVTPSNEKATLYHRVHAITSTALRQS